MCGLHGPRLVWLRSCLLLPQFPCVQSQELQALRGDLRGCCLTPTLSTREVTLCNSPVCESLLPKVSAGL